MRRLVVVAAAAAAAALFYLLAIRRRDGDGASDESRDERPDAIAPTPSASDKPPPLTPPHEYIEIPTKPAPAPPSPPEAPASSPLADAEAFAGTEAADAEAPLEEAAELVAEDDPALAEVLEAIPAPAEPALPPVEEAEEEEALADALRASIDGEGGLAGALAESDAAAVLKRAASTPYSGAVPPSPSKKARSSDDLAAKVFQAPEEADEDDALEEALRASGGRLPVRKTAKFAVFDAAAMAPAPAPAAPAAALKATGNVAAPTPTAQRKAPPTTGGPCSELGN